MYVMASAYCKSNHLFKIMYLTKIIKIDVNLSQFETMPKLQRRACSYTSTSYVCTLRYFLYHELEIALIVLSWGILSGELKI